VVACIAAGFGTGKWGKDPWAGALAPILGGPLPVVPPFDVYCVGPCGPIAGLLSHPEVSTVGNGTQFPVDPLTQDQGMISGGAFPTTDAAIIISKNVPEDFTLEFTVRFDHLPTNFADLVHQHAYFGAASPSGGCVGLFFSKIGLLYTGSIHLNGAGDIVLDTSTQLLPGSQVFVSENEYWTVRLAMSMSTGVVYVYVTKTSELLLIGHQLRYIMPAIPSSQAGVVPPSETFLSVRGTLNAPTSLGIDSICLATGLVIPAIPPIADAGLDQAIRLCSILQLDGSKSFDPAGAPLTYHWRILSAPPNSQYVFDGVDGRTVPSAPPTGFTDRFYSQSLSDLNDVSPILLGDVLIVAGVPHNITFVGTDILGFFVRVEGFVLPDNLGPNTAFKYLRQNGLNTPDIVKPTFYPDVPGIYKFDLTVFNGVLFSLPTEVVVNVVESLVARGCTPDVSFVWNYLSDFWRLVEDTERITTFWQGLAQVAAAELLNLWQVDYSKSLRDIQRTFQRRWMHYDLLMQEDPTLYEVTKTRAVYGGIESFDIPTIGVGGISGTHVDLQLTVRDTPVVISFTKADPYTAIEVQSVLQTALAQFDTRIKVRLLPNRAGTAARVRIDAPFPIQVLSTTTCPLYTAGQANESPKGTAGLGIVTGYVYRAERSLQYLDIKANDFLCLNGMAYRIARLIDDPSDPFYFQRLALLDPLPIPAGATWAISGTVTSTDLNFWTGLCEVSDRVVFEVLDQTTQTLFDVESVVMGATEVLPSSLPVDATPVGKYLADTRYAVYLKGVLRRRYIPIDPLVVDVPLLQEKIVSKDDTRVLRRNVDYFVSEFRSQPCLQFATPVPATAGGSDVWEGADPPSRLWAETSYLDNRPRIEANFGLAAAFTLDDLAQFPSTVDYLSAVRGLWYAYFNGPTLFNLRAGAQILLGLPFAEEAGTIVEIRDDFSVTTGRILVQDLADSTIVREYSFPVSLSMETNPATGQPYVVGDKVAQFAPLVTGVEIIDWVKDPQWFAGYLNQGVFFEVDKFFKFLVRVDSQAFNLATLLFVKSFILRVKPTYTYPLFVVLLRLGNTDVVVSDVVEYHGTLRLYDGACFDGSLGVATMFDEPRPAGGGWRSQFDHNPNPLQPPIFPNPNFPILWGFDKNYLCPEDVIFGTACTAWPGGIPKFDNIFAFDLPVFAANVAQFNAGAHTDVPIAPGLQIGIPVTISAPGTIDSVTLQIAATGVGNPNTYNLVILKNAVQEAVVPFQLTANGFTLNNGLGIVVAAGDVLSCFIVSTVPANIAVDWSGVSVTLGQAVSWAFDTSLPAATYCVYKEM